jgi:hypothetical protein
VPAIFDKPVVKLALALTLVAAFWCGGPPKATADVDPASDVLLLDDVYFPYEPKVCSELQDGLNQLTADAKEASYPVKVALIASESDLGGVPQLLGKPQDYAKFLHGEIGRQIDAVLLIAMPGGFGFAPNKPEARVLDKISIPDDADPNRLTQAAIDAIPQLAGAAGRAVKKPNIASGKCSKKGGTSAVIFIVPVALLLLAGAAITLARRGSSESDEASAPEA